MMFDFNKMQKKIDQGDYYEIQDYVKECVGNDKEGYTRLLWSIGILMNSKVLIDVLIDNGADVNKKNNKEESLLHVLDENGYCMALQLIIKGCSLNARDMYGSTPLHTACVNGYTDIVKLFVAKGANINSRDLKGRTPLWRACEYGHMEVVSVLINNGANVNVVDNKGISVLHWACIRGEDRLCRSLFEKASKEIRCNNSLMHWACWGDSVEVVKFLADNGISVNEKDSTGKTPLIKACAANNVNVVRYLLQREDVDINAQDEIGLTALHFVCVTGLKEIIMLLMEKKASLSIEDIDGRLPIYYACEKKLLDVVVEMIKQGSDVELGDSNVLHWASSNGYASVVDALAERKIDINSQDFLGKSALHFASSKGDVMMVKKLLSNGADINIRDKADGTALHLASKYQFYGVVKELIENGANVNDKDIVGQTALHLACKNGDKDIVSLLLEYKAKADVSTLTGDTPLYIAYTKNFSHILKCLIDKVEKVPDYIVDWIIYEQEFDVMETLICQHKRVDLLLKKLVMLNKKQALKKVAEVLEKKKISISSTRVIRYIKENKKVTLLGAAILNNSLDVADILMRDNSCSACGTMRKLSQLLEDESADKLLNEASNSTVARIKRRKEEIERMSICKLILEGRKRKKRTLVEDITQLKMSPAPKLFKSK